MAMPEKFYVPWDNIDPTLQHGGVEGELGNGWVAPDVGDNPTSTNYDIVGLFKDLNMYAAAISMHPEADSENLPGRALLETALKATSTFFEQVVDKTKTHATSFFAFSHAIPPVNHFTMSPIRFPVRNATANEFVHYCIGTLVELAESSRNALHKGLDPETSSIVLAPLYTWKADIMKYFFDIEVEGEVSPEELLRIFTGIAKPVLSYPDVTADRPTNEQVSEVLTGYDVLAFIPTAGDWAKFAELRLRRFKPERILQPEGARPTTEDVRNESGFTNDGVPVTGTGGPITGASG